MVALEINVLTGPHRNQQFRFPMPVVCTIGRGAGCTVRFAGGDSDLMISREHCELVMDPPHFQICDLGSRNGTYLNGKKIGDNECWVIVEHGDMITLGGTTFRIAVIDQPDAADADSTDASAEKSGTQQDCLVAC